MSNILLTVFSVLAGAVLGVVATKIDYYIKKKKIKKRNERSMRFLPYYNPLQDEIILLRQWNSKDILDERNIKIIYDESRSYDLVAPEIHCEFITNPDEWEKIYAAELKKEKKKTGVVSFVTSLSLDHKDTIQGKELRIVVSSCDYLAHHVNSKYFVKYPNDWTRIKQTIKNGELDAYFCQAMPGNVFVNFIVINGQTNNVLAIRRSNQELNARNIWGLGGFETMNDIKNAPNGAEELNLKGIVYRGLREELALTREEVSEMAISSLSFVKHLGIMVTALVRVDLMGAEEDISKTGESALTESGFIERVLSQSESNFEHSCLNWLPIKLKEMKEFIEHDTGFYKEEIQKYDMKEAKWIGYVKLQMYQIWRNHDSIGITL